MTAPNQPLVLPWLQEKELQLYVKRLDLVNKPVSGNKYYKLKYNIEAASREGHGTLLTFGGAFSNHILATAQAGELYGYKTIGVIRGEELAHTWQHNPTLVAAQMAGMQFKFISREKYRLKDQPTFLNELHREYGSFFMLPEGGSNLLAVKGCEDILESSDLSFDLICCCVGTGGTLAGLVNASSPDQRVLGFASLKSEALKEDICKFTIEKKWDLSAAYHFGGYAKVNKELIDFINNFKKSTGIPLDPVYTGKMMFGIKELAKTSFFKPKTSILAIHSGGLQGINGMNPILKKKNLPLIEL